MIEYFFNSLDLDYEIPQLPKERDGLTCSSELVNRILNKVVKCKYCVVASKSLSSFKGYHIEFYCTKKCDLCRFQFDDSRRYDMDLKRNKNCRQLIWDNKHGY